MLRVRIYNTWDNVAKQSAEGERELTLCYTGEYRRNDVIEFSGLERDRFYRITVDNAVGEALVYVRTDCIRYPVPFYEERESYDPRAFSGSRHYIRICLAEHWETGGMRNLARNPFDRHEVEGVYPHASANVETRGEAVFAARNAIDGIVAVQGHGEWPYSSWGINRRADAEIRIDFGRAVDIREARLYTRADFPHDNWWTAACLCFSDGTEEALRMEKSLGAPHIFSGLDRRCVKWVLLRGLRQSSEPSPFPALTQIELIGEESEG